MIKMRKTHLALLVALLLVDVTLQSEMTSLSDFVALGEKCQLTGPELLKFAKEELASYQAQLRDQRARDREAEKLRAEENKEKLLLQQSLEKEKLLLQQEMKEKELLLQQEMKEKELLLQQEMKEKELLLQQSLERERLAMEKDSKDKELALEKEKLFLQDKELAFNREKLAVDQILQDKQIEGNIKVKMIEKEKDEEIAKSKLNAKALDPIKRYKGILRNYQEHDSISAYFSNAELLFEHYQVPKEDWAIILHQHLAYEPLRLMELIPTSLRTDYDHVRDRILAHYCLDEAGNRSAFRALTPKVNHTFLDFVSETQLAFEKWLKSAKVDENFSKLKDLMLRDKLISAVPEAMATFLVENKCTTVEEMESKGEAYYNAHRDVFEDGSSPIVEVGASARFSSDRRDKRKESIRPPFRPNLQSQNFPTSQTYLVKQSDYRPKSLSQHQFAPRQESRTPYNASKGSWIKFQFCQNSHGSKEMCDQNPQIETYIKNCVSARQSKYNQYNRNFQCFLCKSFGHTRSKCVARPLLRAACADLTSCSDSDDVQVDTAYAETYPMNNKCGTCKEFHENGNLSCGHFVPIEEGNAAITGNGTLPSFNGFVNGVRAKITPDSAATLVGVHRRLIRDTDYTGEFVSCRTFGGRIELFKVAWASINCPIFNGRVKIAVLPNPPSDVLLGNIANVKTCSPQEVEKWEQLYPKHSGSKTRAKLDLREEVNPRNEVITPTQESTTQTDDNNTMTSSLTMVSKTRLPHLKAKRQTLKHNNISQELTNSSLFDINTVKRNNNTIKVSSVQTNTRVIKTMIFYRRKPRHAKEGVT